MNKLLFIIALLLATYGVTRSQDFNYSVSTDSVAWNELNAQTILNTNNSAWNFSYRVPIGFTFHFCGRDFDSLTIETNGYIVFDNDRNYALTAFSGIGDCIDTSGNHSVLGYELSGTAGNHILKIQYKNCSTSRSGGKTLSWQVWLKENGNVEVRIGPSTLRENVITETEIDEETSEETITTTTAIDTTMKFRVGLLNMNMDTEDNGIFLSGNPVAPQAEPVSGYEPEPDYLEVIPNVGYRYTFTAN